MVVYFAAEVQSSLSVGLATCNAKSVVSVIVIGAGDRCCMYVMYGFCVVSSHNACLTSNVYSKKFQVNLLFESKIISEVQPIGSECEN